MNRVSKIPSLYSGRYTGSSGDTVFTTTFRPFSFGTGTVEAGTTIPLDGRYWIIGRKNGYNWFGQINTKTGVITHNSSSESLITKAGALEAMERPNGVRRLYALDWDQQRINYKEFTSTTNDSGTWVEGFSFYDSPSAIYLIASNRFFNWQSILVDYNTGAESYSGGMIYHGNSISSDVVYLSSSSNNQAVNSFILPATPFVPIGGGSSNDIMLYDASSGVFGKTIAADRYNQLLFFLDALDGYIYVCSYNRSKLTKFSVVPDESTYYYFTHIKYLKLKTDQYGKIFVGGTRYIAEAAMGSVGFVESYGNAYIDTWESASLNYAQVFSGTTNQYVTFLGQTNTHYYAGGSNGGLARSTDGYEWEFIPSTNYNPYLPYKSVISNAQIVHLSQSDNGKVTIVRANNYAFVTSNL